MVKGKPGGTAGGSIVAVGQAAGERIRDGRPLEGLPATKSAFAGSNPLFVGAHLEPGWDLAPCPHSHRRDPKRNRLAPRSSSVNYTTEPAAEDRNAEQYWALAWMGTWSHSP